MPKAQQSWVRSKHPPTQWNLRGGRWISVEYTDKKEKKIFLINKEIQSGAVAKSYKRKGFHIFGEMLNYLPIYEEAVSHIWLCNCSILKRKIRFSFSSVQSTSKDFVQDRCESSPGRYDEETASIHYVKLVVLGAPGVGKTSILEVSLDNLDHAKDRCRTAHLFIHW
jgi:hypothetical protein